MLKYKFPGNWDTSNYRGLYYIHTYPDESNPGCLMSKSGVDTCREFYVRRYRGIINEQDGFTPWARKAYCLLSYGYPQRSEFNAWNTELQEAAEKGLVTLKGHRSVGGMRASIYNAMPEEGVKKLVEFINKFEEENS